MDSLRRDPEESLHLLLPSIANGTRTNALVNNSTTSYFVSFAFSRRESLPTFALERSRKLEVVDGGYAPRRITHRALLRLRIRDYKEEVTAFVVPSL